MSMRKGWWGRRQPRALPDEYARFINSNGMTIYHQKRDVSNKCTACWDDLIGDYDPVCPECFGSGFTVIVSPTATLPRLKAYAPFTQPAGNMGNAGQIFKAGGQHTRYAAYVYTDLNTGTRVERGDRLIVNQRGLRQELVVMNHLPIMAGEVQLGFVSECNSASNVVLEEVPG